MKVFLGQIHEYHVYTFKAYILDNIFGQNYFLLTVHILGHHSLVTRGSRNFCTLPRSIKSIGKRWHYR